MTNHRPVAATLFDEAITFTDIIWLAALSANPSDDKLEEVFEKYSERMEEILGLKFKRFTGTQLNHERLHDALYERGKLGFLVQASTPIPTYERDLPGFSAGFGYTLNAWFYTDDLASPQFFEELKAWKNDIHAKRKSEAGVSV